MSSSASGVDCGGSASWFCALCVRWARWCSVKLRANGPYCPFAACLRPGSLDIPPGQGVASRDSGAVVLCVGSSFTLANRWPGGLRLWCFRSSRLQCPELGHLWSASVARHFGASWPIWRIHAYLASFSVCGLGFVFPLRLLVLVFHVRTFKPSLVRSREPLKNFAPIRLPPCWVSAH